MSDLLSRSLDDLAARADTAPVGDRLTGIQTRARRARRRQQVIGATGAVAALAVIGGLALGDGPGGRNAGYADDPSPSQNPTPSETSQPAPSAQLAVSDLKVQRLKSGRLSVQFRLHGASAAYSDLATGEVMPDVGGPMNTRILVDGKELGGSDGGGMECKPTDVLVTYDEQFGAPGMPMTFKKAPAGPVQVKVTAPYCTLDGTLATAEAEVTLD